MSETRPGDWCMLDDERPVMARLDALGIRTERYGHPPIASSADADAHWRDIDAVHCKNLFLRNQAGTRHYLVILPAHARADLRRVAHDVGDGKLSFGSADRLARYLCVRPGSVSPFGLIHDTERHVRVYVERTLQQAARVSFHPNINTRTLVLEASAFLRYLASTGHAVAFIDVVQREGDRSSDVQDK